MKISILTPVLNGVTHFEQTIQSVLSQGYQNLEYIVIDGGSTDGTIEIIKKYESKMAYWESKPDRGISDAFNKGIEKATGDIIGIINADDWYEPYAFEIIATYYNSNPEFDIFYGKTRFTANKRHEFFTDNALAHIHLFQRMSLSHPGVFVTKETYQKVGVFNTKYKLAMDYEFLLRALLSGARFKFIDHHIANFRAGGLTYRFFNKGLEECNVIRQTLYREFNINQPAKKKIISFSLWGNNPKYTAGAIENAKLISQIYGKEWIGRFYCGRSVHSKIIDQLKSISRIEVICMKESGDWRGLFWRFYPASEDDIQVMLSRDTDSRLSIREKIAVDEWLSGEKAFHIMRDHPCHNALILGGMWGCRKGAIQNIKEKIAKYKTGNYWQNDQEFLRDIIYPEIRENCLVHDSFFGYESHARPFPLKRKGDEFVGQIFDQYNKPERAFYNSIENFRYKKKKF